MIVKRWAWWTIIAAVLAFLFVGYGYTRKVEAQKYYNQAVEAGKQSIRDGNYEAARLSYRDALKKKPSDDLAETVVDQITDYQKGWKDMNEGRYSEACRKFERVSNVDSGSALLVQRSSSLATELKEVIKERKIFQKVYRKAKVLSENYEYTASNTKLAVILGYGSIKEGYYRDVYHDARKLKEYNDRILRSLGYTVDDDSSGADSTRSSRYSKNTRQDVVSGVSGASASSAERNITDAEIRQARHDLKAQGLDEKSFTDDQVRQVILRAGSEGKTVRQVADEFK